MAKKTDAEHLRDLLSRPNTDPYDVLGVPQDATQRTIKSAYRRLAKRHHPDKNKGDPTAEGRFKAIAEAYGVLSDPDRRAFYDLHRDDLRWEEDDAPKSRSKSSAHSSAKEETESAKEKEVNVFMGIVGGLPHYHMGRIVVCSTCGMGIFVTNLTTCVTPSEEGTNTLPGGAYHFQNAAKGKH